MWFLCYSENMREVGRVRRKPGKGELGLVARIHPVSSMPRYQDRIYQLLGLHSTAAKGLLEGKQLYKCPQ